MYNSNLLSYREVVLEHVNKENWNEISLNTGGTQSTLQDIKVAEKAGGFFYGSSKNSLKRNRFIYWRAYNDVLELSEVSLDINLIGCNLRYKFNDSPVLSVNLVEQNSNIYVLVATVSSLHKMHFPSPDNQQRSGDFGESKSYSIFHRASTTPVKEYTTFHVIAQTASLNNPMPHTATSCLSANGQEVYFGLAYQNSLMLFIMNCENGQTVANALRESHIMPRIISNITGALRGKTNSDSQQATSLVFCIINAQAYLVALYRDNNIRLWSATGAQCVCTFNCVRDGAEIKTQGAQNNMLRKVDDYNLCTFLCHSTGSEFANIKIIWDGSANLAMTRTNVVPAPPYDLADFQATESRIWALWCNIQGEFSISSFYLTPGSGVNWISAAMEPPPDRYSVCVDQGTDPRQAYCSYIFHPGKFEKSVISKALMMFRRLNVLGDPNVPMSVLKDRVCQAVETEIQNEIKDFDISDDEYIDIATRFWERFYSCCEQYHIKACQPVGIVLLESLDGICVIKKNTFSLLRPCEFLEHLMLAGDSLETDSFIATHFADNKTDGDNLIQLVILLSMLEQWLTDEIKSDFDKRLFRLEMPSSVVSKLVSEILSADQSEQILPPGFLVKIRQKIQSISDLRAAMLLLLDCLRFDCDEDQNLLDHSRLGELTKFFNLHGNFYEGSFGVSMIAESVRQLALIRYSLCRNLLILQQILIETFGLSCEVLETIRSHFMPETVIFIQAYYLMVWVCEAPFNVNNMATIENNIQRLSSLQLCENRRPFRSQIESSTLLRIFLDSKGLYGAISSLSDTALESLREGKWRNSLLPVITGVAQLLWPISSNFTLGEWLFSTCQHIIIQEYVRLLNNWCHRNSNSRQFILAVSLLECGETHKAYDLFLQSFKGVTTEAFLNSKILKTNTDLTQNESIAQYFLKVIELFERHCALDYVIVLAQDAIGLLDKTSEQLSMFQSIIFNNHLILEHYEEAYHSLIYNAETTRRKDCLRQLVVRLFNKKRLDLLMHFPYVGLQDDFEAIIEARARSMGVDDNEHYNFLHAFHVTKGNMRKAAAIMYEQAMRFLLECDSTSSMEKRYDCLLACVNCLNLVDERYMWIAKPVINEEYANGDGDVEMSPGRNTQQLQVLELQDIKKELLLTEALLTLCRHKKDIGNIINAEAQELSVILANTGLFTAALKLANGLNINVVPVFDALTLACVRINDDDTNERWSWLQENDLADIPNKNSAADMAWLLLQSLMSSYESDKVSSIRKSVANKILGLGAFLPQWLQASYMQEDPSGLLRLLVMHGRLIEAADIAKELIRDLLEHRKQFYNLKHSFSSIDLLLYGLSLNFESIEYKRCHAELVDLMKPKGTV